MNEISKTGMVRVSCGAETIVCTSADAIEEAGKLLAKTGLSWSALSFVAIDGPAILMTQKPPTDAELDDVPPRVTDKIVSVARYSEFGAGRQVMDEVAKSRIEAQHSALAAAGVKIDTKEQLFATGTRMARSGYEEQARRAKEHAKKQPFAVAAEELRARIQAEGRTDMVVPAGELAREITLNGTISAFGFRLTEQALRGICFRTESPSLRYLLGLRERIASEIAKGNEADVEGIRGDKAKIAEILRHECMRNPGAELRLRCRAGVGDVYAVVSPTYGEADADGMVEQILAHTGPDARGTWAYDPESTAWELRMECHTTTPVEEQAVGEAFEGYASFQSRDNGTGRLRGGGGVTLIRCLNASTYFADAKQASRIHRSGIKTDVPALIEHATKAVGALCTAWGVARGHVVETPSGVSLEDAIPGFWRWLLRDRNSELAGVLPGRSERHVEALSAVFPSERRDADRLVRSDFGQAWTRYVQGQPSDVRRDAEAAAGRWIESDREIGHDAG